VIYFPLKKEPVLSEAEGGIKGVVGCWMWNMSTMMFNGKSET
jgi:hypothetical protein